MKNFRKQFVVFMIAGLLLLLGVIPASLADNGSSIVVPASENYSRTMTDSQILGDADVACEHKGARLEKLNLTSYFLIDENTHVQREVFYNNCKTCIELGNELLYFRDTTKNHTLSQSRWCQCGYDAQKYVPNCDHTSSVQGDEERYHSSYNESLHEVRVEYKSYCQTCGDTIDFSMHMYCEEHLDDGYQGCMKCTHGTEHEQIYDSREVETYELYDENCHYRVCTDFNGCRDCDYANTFEISKYAEPHNLVEGKCICGYGNGVGCAHKDVEDTIDIDYSYEYSTSHDVRVRIEKWCKDCNEYLEYVRSTYNEPHIWTEENNCEICNYTADGTTGCEHGSFRSTDEGLEVRYEPSEETEKHFKITKYYMQCETCYKLDTQRCINIRKEFHVYKNGVCGCGATEPNTVTVVTAPEACNEEGYPILQGKLTLTGNYQYSDFSVGFQFYDFKTDSWSDANYSLAGTDQSFTIIVRDAQDGRYAYRAAAKNNTTNEEYFGERREYVLGEDTGLSAPIPIQSNMIVNRGATVTISWAASEGAERYGVWFYDTNPGTYVDAGNSLSVIHVFEHNNPKDAPFAVQIYALAGAGENQKQSEPATVLVTVGCAEGDHDFSGGTVYDHTLFKAIDGDHEYHLAYADVYKQTCIECGMGGFETTVDRDAAKQEKVKHSYMDGICQADGCMYICGHNYVDKLENGEKVPVANSGIWENKGNSGHVCSVIEYVTQCQYCLLESTREEVYPYGDEVQSHMPHTEVLAYGYDISNHWSVKVRETCGALGCNYDVVREKEGKHEPHEMKNGSCIACGNGVQTGTFKYGGFINSNADATATYYYSDSYFDADATGEANPHLATMSLCLELSAWTSFDTPKKWNAYEKTQNVRKLLEEIGFKKESIKHNDDWETKPAMNSIGAVAAYKNIGDTTIIALAVRGGGYASEWGGNFNIGADKNHKGFEEARDGVLDFLKEYIDDYYSQFKPTVKLWLVGFSRGGATANMVAGALLDNIKEADVGIVFEPENLFAYTFEAPMGYVGNNAGYPSIKNYVLTYDLVPLVAPSDWGFGRYNDDILLLENSLCTERYKELVLEFEKQYEKVKAGVPYHKDNQNSEYRIKEYADKIKIEYEPLSGWLWTLNPVQAAVLSDVALVEAIKSAKVVESNIPTDAMLSNSVDILFKHFPGQREGFAKNIEEQLTEFISYLTDYEFPNVDLTRVLKDALLVDNFEGLVKIVFALDPRFNVQEQIEDIANDLALRVCNEIQKQTGKKLTGSMENAVQGLVSALLSTFEDSPDELMSFIYYVVQTGFQFHWPEVSLAWMMSKDSYYTGLETTAAKNPETWRTVMINCPVDVIVYDEYGNEFATIRGETVTNISNVHGVSITETGSKQVILPADASYTIKIIATGDGTMDYTVYEYNVRDRKYNLVESYQQLPLTAGDSYYGTVPKLRVEDYYDTESDGSTVEYTLLEPKGNVLKPDTVLRGNDIYHATVSLSTNNKKGFVTGGGSFVATEFAQVEAICMPTVQFLGWYQNGQLVSSEAVYRFAVMENTELVAHFSEGDYHTLHVANTDGGIVPEGSFEVPATIQIQMKAEPFEDYEFICWEATAGTFDNPNSIEAVFTMPSEDVTIIAVFQPKNAIVLPQTGDNSSLGFYLMLLAVSACVIVISTKKRIIESSK